MAKEKKELKIEILYKGKDMLVINKPAGLITHPDGRTEEQSLSKWLLKKYPQVKNVGEDLRYEDGRVIKKEGIVHRLDRETSGALAVALTKEAFLYLKKQFEGRTVIKKYHAFLWGELKKDESKIDRHIGRSATDPRLWSATRGARGTMRDALTFYRVLWRGNGFTFVEVEPKTGRTHQIRVHFKSINYPVVSDMLYAKGQGKALGFERTALHSKSLEIKNTDGEVVVVEAPYPNDFKRAIKSLKIPKLPI